MVFNLREAVSGWSHLRLRWERKLFARPENHYLPLYSSAPFGISTYTDYDGKLSICEVCGYTNMRADLPDGWTIETCSAMPAIPAFQSTEFQEWLKSLPKTKLPTTCI